jgi:hypothetical protein
LGRLFWHAVSALFHPILGNGRVFPLALKVKKCSDTISQGGPGPKSRRRGTPHVPFVCFDHFSQHPSRSFTVTPQMTRGRPLSQDLRWSLLKMARVHDIRTISKLTGVGKRTVERLMSDYRKYGTAARWGPGRSLRGQKRKLTARNVEVQSSIFDCTCCIVILTRQTVSTWLYLLPQ